MAADLTKPCMDGCTELQKQKAATIWQTLNQTLPPAILLLFLLATLGGLYRYSLRLAGFHASRADLLEMYILNREMFEGEVKDGQPSKFVQFANAFAADKVEFGKANTPADQAVEMVRAIMSRSS